jgi:hypothetical protein
LHFHLQMSCNINMDIELVAPLIESVRQIS